MMTPEPACECAGPGLCPRYGLVQDQHHVELCRRDPAMRRKWRERKEGRRAPAPQAPYRPAPAAGPPPPPGVGTELRKLIASLGLPACLPCQDRAYQMDEWGVEGCLANRGAVLAWLRGQHEKLGWAAKLKAATLAALQPGLALKLAAGDPAEVLFEEALARARAKPPPG